MKNPIFFCWLLIISLFIPKLYAQTFTEINAGLTGVYGSSVAWGDYDNDGDLDILLTGWTGSTSVSKVYRNNGNNSFTEQTGISLMGIYFSSVAWGDYDNDGNLDILLTGQTGSTSISRIYRNNGNNSFTEQTGISLTGVYYSSVAWGDYDNDGDLDILLTGFSSYGSKIYRNNGDNSFTEQTGIWLTSVRESSVAWGDYDNDGDLDILLTGNAGYSEKIYVSKIYRNNGDNSFSEQTGISLEGVSNSSVAWGDYDNDGDLDILLTGESSMGSISKIYSNNGDNSFTEQTGISLTGVSNSSTAWGDYDSDGDLDILLTGYTGSAKVSKIYRNNGDNSFTEQTGISLTGVRESSVAWGDYDNDGDLDILLTGSGFSKIYNNNNLTPNSVPSAPSGLIASTTGSGITFYWDKSSDTETPQKGLTYNLYIGTSSSSGQVKSPMTNISDGYRRIVQLGNVNHNNSWTIKNLPAGIYYWSAQAIDNSFAGSPFAIEETFDIFITVQSPNGGENWFAGINQNIKWSSYDVQNVKIEYTTNGTDWVTIVESTPAAMGSYLWKVPNTPSTQCKIRISDVANPNVCDISDGGFTIYFEQFTAQTGIDLTGVCYSSVAWGDYDNDGDLDIFITGTSSSGSVSKIYRNNGDNSFTEQTGIRIGYGPVAWGDYDNDGDLDILQTGFGYSKIYRNNGNSSFTEQTGISLTGVSSSSVAWGDYDNDGDLDILLTGLVTGLDHDWNDISKIYRNNGNNSFTEQTGINLTGVSYSSVAWGDYDNDGDLDIFITGTSSSGSVSKIYRNNGDNSFTEQTGINLTGVSFRSVAWGDYDNDGYLDILLTGSGWSKIYRNNGNNSFTEHTGINLTGVSYGSVAWGDYNNDGYLDILLTGYCYRDDANIDFVSKIYRNNRDNSFTEQTGINLTNVKFSSVAWGDYDNDGDLDILLTGLGGPCYYVSKIYRNNNLNPNSVPAAPSGLTASATGSDVTFSWDKSSDTETPQNGLTYNLRIGTMPGGNEVMSAHSDISSGYRRIVSLGNSQKRKRWTIKNLPEDIYYCSVQAIDGAYAGSVFAEEQSFIIDAPPTVPQNLTAIAGNHKITLRWSLNTEPDMHKYNIYRDTSSPAITLVDSVVSSSPPDTFYVNTGLTNGQIYFYRITAVDSALNESVYSDEISATPNGPPIWSDIPDTKFEEDDSLIIDLDDYVSDDSDPYSTLTITISGGDKITAVIDSQTHIVKFSTDPDSSGFFEQFVLTATDTGRLFATDTIYISVMPVNDPPEITTTELPDAAEDQEYSFEIEASDVDLVCGDHLTYSLTISPEGMTINGSNGEISWLPNNDDVGDTTVTVVVTDDSSATDMKTYTLIVINVNDPPILSAIPDTSFYEDNRLIISKSFFYTYVDDPDNADSTLTFAFSNTDYINVNASGDSLLLYAQTNWYGVDKIDVIVSDGSLSDTTSWRITVNPVNDAPVITSADSVSATEDIHFKYIATASDIEDSFINFTFENLPCWLSADADSVYGTPYEGIKDTSFVVIASDGELNDTMTVFLEVIPVNDPPLAYSYSDTLDEDQSLIITFEGEDVDGDTFTFSVLDSTDYGVLTGLVPDVTYIPDADYFGTDELAFTITDIHGAQDTGIVSILILAINDAPIAVYREDHVKEETVLNLTLIATDVDDNELSYTVLDSTLHGILSGSAPNLNYMPDDDYNGFDSLTFMVSDGNLRDTGKFKIEIIPINDPPIISSIPDTSFNEDEQLKFSISYFYDFVYDPDNADSTFTWSFSDTDYVYVTMDEDSVTLSSQIDWFGKDSLFTIVSDGEFSDKASFLITVYPVNDAPYFTELMPDSMSFGSNVRDTLLLTELASDVDNPDTSLVWSYIHSSFVSCDINDTLNSAVFWVEENMSGQDTIVLSVFDGELAVYDSLIVIVNTVTKIDYLMNQIPKEYSLKQNYPNPFNPVTNILYGIPKQSHVNIKIYNLLGREVKTLVNQDQEAKYYKILWDAKNNFGNNVSSGMYFCRIIAESDNRVFTKTKKLLLLR